MLISLAPLITALALAPISLHFVSAALQAGMVTLLITDLVSPRLFSLFVPAYLGCLYFALYLALTSKAGKPNYWTCAAIVLPIPVIDGVHDHLSSTLDGAALHAYLVWITGYTLLAVLVMLAVHLRNHVALARNAAKPSLYSRTDNSKASLQLTI